MRKTIKSELEFFAEHLFHRIFVETGPLLNWIYHGNLILPYFEFELLLLRSPKLCT